MFTGSSGSLAFVFKRHPSFSYGVGITCLNVLYRTFNRFGLPNFLVEKTSDPYIKFHNNSFSRFYVNREQDLRGTHGNINTYKQTDRNFVEGVFVHNFTWNVCNQNLPWFGPMYRQNLNYIYIYIEREREREIKKKYKNVIIWQWI